MNKADDKVTSINSDESTESTESTSTFKDIDEKVLRNEEVYNRRKTEYEGVTAQRKKLYYMLMVFTVCFFILIFTSYINQGLYKIDTDTLLIIRQAFNALILLMIPFLLGSLGAFTRVLISGLKVGNSTTLIIASGLMSVFSWISIKSGILISLIAPHIEQKGLNIKQSMSTSETEFYTMALVAILVGMFSSNVYIFINQKVEQLTNNPNKRINKD